MGQYDVSNTQDADEKEKYSSSDRKLYEYWAEELKSSDKMLEKWLKKADKITKRYHGLMTSQTNNLDGGFKLNLFHSNIKTLEDMLYGNTPKVEASRRFADSADDVGRVAANTIERLINLDIQDNGNEIDSILQSVLQDRLLPGLGCARVRYEVDEEQGQVTDERAPIDYYYWGDVRWGWCRNYADMPWLAFRSYLSKDKFEARFGAEHAKNATLTTHTADAHEDSNSDPDRNQPRQRIEVWEIWDKDTRRVLWLTPGVKTIIDAKDDPLGLNAFFPAPPFFLANPTTSLYMPTPDFQLAQDLYNEIDKLQERISIITEAVRVVGVYDASADEIKQMFNAGMDNQLIPVKSWALFSEKQGLKGQIDWVPIDTIANALDKLVQMRNDAISLLYQVTGMSDIMRGGLESPYEGVGQSEIKAKFGSIRVQALQDQFAKFASDLMQIKAEIIARHWSPETIARKSNMGKSHDVELLPQAIELIKNPRAAQIAVTIRPETVAMVDYAQLKAERTEFINALATYMQSATPLMEADPGAKPIILQLLQWALAGFKGASEIEGVIDKAIEMANQQAGQEKPDAEQARLNMQMQLEQVKAQIEMQKIQAKAQADAQNRELDKQADIATAYAQHQAKMAELEADLQADIAKVRAKMEADILTEQAQSAANAQQAAITAETEIQKDVAAAELDIATEAEKTRLKIAELGAQSAAKIREMKANPPKESKPDEQGE